ncbi:hypothetical protein J6590_020583 [Homalodisca vitripennis]|nr:hypothetical protein J6590_020583 [Homalodisca vitripennis]
MSRVMWYVCPVRLEPYTKNTTDVYRDTDGCTVAGLYNVSRTARHVRSVEVQTPAASPSTPPRLSLLASFDKSILQSYKGHLRLPYLNFCPQNLRLLQKPIRFEGSCSPISLGLRIYAPRNLFRIFEMAGQFNQICSADSSSSPESLHFSVALLPLPAELTSGSQNQGTEREEERRRQRLVLGFTAHFTAVRLRVDELYSASRFLFGSLKPQSICRSGNLLTQLSSGQIGCGHGGRGELYCACNLCCLWTITCDQRFSAYTESIDVQHHLSPCVVAFKTNTTI